MSESRLLSSRHCAKSLMLAAVLLGGLIFRSHADAALAADISATDIRVRLEKIESGAVLTGTGLRYPGMGSQNYRGGFGGLRVRWEKATGDSSGELYHWKIEERETGKILSEVKARALGLVGSGLRLNLKSVPDRLTIRPHAKRVKQIKMKSPEADLIATLNLEDYIRGVLPAEMPAHWPLEALKAQAVAARSYALHRRALREQEGAAFHVEANVMDQVFIMPLPAHEENAKNVDRAVRETRGIILADSRLKPIAAYYHADCGGRTDEPQAVWGSAEKIGTAIDGSCPLNPLAKWRADLSLAEIAERLRGGKRNLLRQLESVQVADRSASGRITRLKLAWKNGEETFLSGHQFRMSMGFERIKSTNFQIVSGSGSGSGPGSGLKISGQGFGHGVGLCQWGAKHQASQGRDFRSILKHYYPQLRLVDPTPEPTEPRLQAQIQ